MKPGDPRIGWNVDRECDPVFLGACLWGSGDYSPVLMPTMQREHNQAILSPRCLEPRPEPGPGLLLGTMGANDPLSQ